MDKEKEMTTMHHQLGLERETVVFCFPPFVLLSVGRNCVCVCALDDDLKSSWNVDWRRPGIGQEIPFGPRSILSAAFQGPSPIPFSAIGLVAFMSLRSFYCSILDRVANAIFLGSLLSF